MARKTLNTKKPYLEISLARKQNAPTSIEATRPVTVDSPLWTASCTEIFTTNCALQFVERGKLYLDANVGDVLLEVQKFEILTAFDEASNPQYMKPTRVITLRYPLSKQSGRT